MYFSNMLPTWRTLTRHQGISYIELDNSCAIFCYKTIGKLVFSQFFKQLSFNTLATFTTLLRHKNIHKIVMNYFLRIIYSANIIMNHISNWKWDNQISKVYMWGSIFFACFSCNVKSLVEDIRTMLGKQWCIFSCNIKISK